jgi:hypothetical protein
MRAGLVLLAACHVTSEVETIRPGSVHREVTGDPTPGAPSLSITDDGKLRFVEGLNCASDDIVEQQSVITTSVRPNLATFVTGVIATAAGGITTARGAVGGDGITTAIGAIILAVGAPFAIGPFLGNSSVDREGAPRAPLRHPGASQPCGQRALAGASATLDIKGMHIFGRVDDGTFAIPVYQWIDAFAPPQSAWNVDVALDNRTYSAVLDADAVARGAKGFIDHADFDATIEPMRVVPNLTGSTAIVLADGPAARITLSIRNDGPGDSYALRGTIEARVPALDGRIIYVGRVSKNSTVTKDLLVPLSTHDAAELAGSTIDLAVQLHDAHGTAPDLPIRFRGTVR